MKLEGIYHTAKFKERPNRFLAIVELNNFRKNKKAVLAHVPDPGRLIELLKVNVEVILQENPKLKRKTKYSLVGIRSNNIWVNIDSQLSNALFKEEYKKISTFENLEIVKSEFTYGKSRFDFLMRTKESHQLTLVEIKSVTLVNNFRAFFPDAPTSRGVKHINELIKAIDQGYKASIVFIIKRNDAYSFAPNRAIDIKFSLALRQAYQKGVQISAVKCLYDPIGTNELKILEEIPTTRI